MVLVWWVLGCRGGVVLLLLLYVCSRCQWAWEVMAITKVVWGPVESLELNQAVHVGVHAQDPKLWIVKCKPGAEREVCVQLMQKCIDKAGTKDELQIKSVLAQDHLKGYVRWRTRALTLTPTNKLRTVVYFIVGSSQRVGWIPYQRGAVWQMV